MNDITHQLVSCDPLLEISCTQTVYILAGIRRPSV